MLSAYKKKMLILSLVNSYQAKITMCTHLQQPSLSLLYY